jgi:hypothetical protein
VLTPPEDLTDADLRAALRSGWAFNAVSVEYQAVGFGSYHWLATAAGGSRVFATADDLIAKLRTAQDSTDAAFGRLRAAFGAAYALREHAGLSFVVAPLVDLQGLTLRRLSDRYSLVVHPFLPSREADLQADGYWRAVAGLLVELHAASCPVAPADDFVVPGRDRLVQLLDEAAEPWDRGPYGERARALLARHAAGVKRLLPAYDRLAAHVSARPERMVVTHGEPHNTLVTSRGLMLIDWESLLVAPRERDLWALSDHDGSALDWYRAATGVEIDRAALSLYRLWYDLAEISGYLGLFHAPHADTADAAESWRNLVHLLRPAARWPELAG